jgi:hypothetical protein
MLSHIFSSDQIFSVLFLFYMHSFRMTKTCNFRTFAKIRLPSRVASCWLKKGQISEQVGSSWQRGRGRGGGAGRGIKERGQLNLVSCVRLVKEQRKCPINWGDTKKYKTSALPLHKKMEP